jgi:melibiose permease
VSIIAPVILNKFGTYNEAIKGYDWTAKGYIVCASVFAGMLVFFALLSMSRVKETAHEKAKEKFSFRTIFEVLRHNDQLRVFILFALLSNTGFYTVSGVKDHFFKVVVAAESTAGWFTLSKFKLFMTVGSVLGLVVVPIMLKFTSRRRIYQTSLLVAIAGYAGMSFSGLAHQWLLMSISYFVNQIGTASMFVSQTVFLSDVVDYGEVKMGRRKESVTFSMKGFLQKMAYTVQTIILNLTLSIVHYNKETDLISSGAQTLYSRRVVNGIKGIMYIVPAICFLLSLIVFSTKFKLHGAYMEDITAQVTAAREARIREAEVGAEEAGS